MTDISGRHEQGDGAAAPQLPTKYLPGVESRDLPEPVPFKKVVGASVIILASALGAGEYIAWPYITSRVGLGLIWLAVVAFLFSLVVYMEIERYTLATGETAVTGFSRLWKPWGLVFVIGSLLTYIWPGWAATSAQMFTIAFNLGAGSIIATGIIMLFAIGIGLTLSPVIYESVEKIDSVLVAIVTAFIVLGVVLATNASAWLAVITEAPAGVTQFPQFVEEIGGPVLFGALALIGGNGFNLLVQSNYIRDKGLGMGRYIPRIVSPVTGHEEARPSLGYMFPQTEENLRRWRGWWRLANQEQLLVFFLLGVITLVMLPVLTYSVVPVGANLGEGLAFIQAEGETLGELIAPWFETFFYLAGFVLLFSTALGTLDFVGRLTADTLKVGYLTESRFWSESKIYLIVVWFLIITGSLILMSGVAQPFVLLIIASVGQGIGMVVYIALLIQLNRRALPDAIKLKSWRLVAMVLAFLLYGGLAGFMAISYFSV